MPWKVETLMSAREEFIALALSGAVSMTALCDRFGISRKTGYKWLWRYAAGGEDSLRDRSHRRHTCPHRTSRELEERIIPDDRVRSVDVSGRISFVRAAGTVSAGPLPTNRTLCDPPQPMASGTCTSQYNV